MINNQQGSKLVALEAVASLSYRAIHKEQVSVEPAAKPRSDTLLVDLVMESIFQTEYTNMSSSEHHVD